jgi:hypothetical protein
MLEITCERQPVHTNGPEASFDRSGRMQTSAAFKPTSNTRELFDNRVVQKSDHFWEAAHRHQPPKATLIGKSDRMTQWSNSFCQKHKPPHRHAGQSGREQLLSRLPCHHLGQTGMNNTPGRHTLHSAAQCSLLPSPFDGKIWTWSAVRRSSRSKG